MATISALYIYPVKGLGGIAVNRSRVGPRGLEGDRRWMITRENGQFLTQREVPELCRIATALEGDTLVLRGARELSVPRELREGRPLEVTVWSSTVRALAHEPAREWLRAELGGDFHLVYMPDGSERFVNPSYGRPGDVVSFADAYPVLVTTLASLDDLNARMAAPISMRRFRPNVVLAGTRAWEEDTWTGVASGEVRLRVVKPCDRCVVTTIDPDDGSRGKEPLATLATFRARDSKVYFGQNAIPDTLGELAVGDVVTVS